MLKIFINISLLVSLFLDEFPMGKKTIINWLMNTWVININYEDSVDNYEVQSESLNYSLTP